jgi:hypothetical protein
MVIFSKLTAGMRILLVLGSILPSLLILQVASAQQASVQQAAVQSAGAAQPAPRQAPAKKARKKAAPEPPPVPAPPPPPPTLEQMPALPPQVQYNQGQLTIVAENSTLADILRAVRTQIKAEVEIPANANERVVGHFGPGPARDVLTSLLHGSHFNYVMVGSAAHPDGVDRLLLTSKSGGTPEPGKAVVAAPPQPQTNNEGSGDEAATSSPDADPPPEEAPENATNGEAPPPTPDSQQPAKTPEQLLRELQQQQLLQQQQQQQQGQPGAPPQN